MEPTKELIDALYREEVLRARRTPPDEKFVAGFTLFEFACGITKDGIRNQFPNANEEEVLRILKDRFRLRARLEAVR